jgi:putative transposase
VNLTRSMWYYQSKKDDGEIIDKLDQLAEQYPNRGFDNYYGRIRAEGLPWNRKRVLRVYRMMNLGMRRKRKKRILSREPQALVIPSRLNDTWSMDFMSDTLVTGRRFRVLNIIDDYNREALVTDSQHSFPAEDVVKTLDDLVFLRGKPGHIRVDNGPEFTAKVFVDWCQENDITIKYIQPGKPVQNALIERFNRLFREDILDAYLFDNIHQVESLANKWKEDYNENHPHGSLGGLSPRKYARINNQNSNEKTILAAS